MYIYPNNYYDIKDIFNDICNINNNKKRDLRLDFSKFKNIFTNLHPMLASRQNDAIEFIRILLNDISLENNINKSSYNYLKI